MRATLRLVKHLSVASHQHLREALARVEPRESSFVVPSTSSQAHSEQEISQKGFILLKLAQQGYPVPDFVVLTTEAYTDRREHLGEHVADAIRQLESLTMQTSGHGKSPLVFAIRCATAHYIPGLMDTYLNVGVTESTLPSLEKMYGAVGARKMFLNNLRNLCQALHREEYASIVSGVRSDLHPDEVERLINQLDEIIRKTDRRLVEDPLFQAEFFAKQAYRHFEENRELVLTLCREQNIIPASFCRR